MEVIVAISKISVLKYAKVGNGLYLLNFSTDGIADESGNNEIRNLK
jgi:hypothetical protein